MIHGVLHINGKPVERERVDDYVVTDERRRAAHAPLSRDAAERRQLSRRSTSSTTASATTPQVYEVPEGHFFMMGDNRDNSTDSRVLSEVGFVPFENLVGRAESSSSRSRMSSSFWQVWHWPSDGALVAHIANGAVIRGCRG